MRAQEESILALATKLGIVVVGSAICPPAAVLGVVEGGVIGGILGNSAWDFLKTGTARLTRRPVLLGEPNHDLNKALARAIATACQEFKSDLGKTAEETFHDEANILGPFSGVDAYKVADFFKGLRKSKTAENLLTIVADNAALKNYLESGDDTQAALPDVLKVNFARDAFPDLPEEARNWIVENLHRRIAVRFWDEVKGDPRAWRAYAAEVFKEFRDEFKTLKGNQVEILRVLEDLNIRRDQFLGEGYDPSVSEAAIASVEATLPMPDEVHTAIENLQGTLLEEIEKLNAKADTILSKLSALRGQVAKVALGTNKNFKIAVISFVSILLLAGLIIGTTKYLNIKLVRLEAKIELTTADLRARMIAASETVLEEDLRVADQNKGGWKIRDEQKKAAEAAYSYRKIRIDKLARELARLEGTDEASEIFNEMTRVIDEEGIDEALNFLENHRPKVLAEVAAESTEQKSVRRKKLLPFFSGAELAITAGKNDTAESWFRDVIDADPNWLEARYSFCKFLIYTKGRPVQTHRSVAAATIIYKEAHRIARRLTEDQPENESYFRELSVCHSELGDLAMKQGDLEGAAGHFDASLNIRETLHASHPSNAGRQGDLSVIYNKLGSVATVQGDLERAAKNYYAGLEIVEILAASDPKNAKWQRDLSFCYTFLGDLAVEQKDLKRAAKYFSQGLIIAKKLDLDDSRNVELQRDLSVSHYRLGDVVKAEGNLEGARFHYSKGFDLARTLAASDPSNVEWQRDLSISHDRLGSLAVASKGLKEATAQYKASQKIRQKLVTNDPGNMDWKLNLSVSHEQLGDVAKARGDLDSATTFFDASLEIREELVAIDPSNAKWQRTLSVSYSRLGNVALERGNLEAAATHFGAGLKIREKLVAIDPSNAEYLLDLSGSYISLGDVATRSDDLKTAATHFGAGLNIREKLAENDLGNAQLQQKLSVSVERMGKTVQGQGNLSAAAALYEKSCAIWQALIDKDGSNMEWQRGIIAPLFGLGDVAMISGDLGTAATHFGAALEIAEKLAASDLENAQWQRNVFVSHIKLANLAGKQKDGTLASRHWQASYNAINGIRQRGGYISPGDLKILDQLQKMPGIKSHNQ